MRISCYGDAFNIEKFNFKIEDAVRNFSAFFDEVICTTVPSQDNTWDILKNLESKYPKFKVIYSNIQTIGNNKWEGQLKTESMRWCSNEIRVMVDYDEVFPMSNRQKWYELAYVLNENKSKIDGVLIPSIDLWGHEKFIRSDKNIGFRFRMHTSTVFKRDTVNFAKLEGDLFDIEKSDGTEPVDENGNLCRFTSVVPKEFLIPQNAHQLVNHAHSFHYGYVDFKRKYTLAEGFWNKIWTDYQQKKEVRLESPEEMSRNPVIEHNLPLI